MDRLSEESKRIKAQADKILKESGRERSWREINLTKPYWKKESPPWKNLKNLSRDKTFQYS